MAKAGTFEIAVGGAERTAVRLFAALDLPDEVRGQLAAWGASELRIPPFGPCARKLSI